MDQQFSHPIIGREKEVENLAEVLQLFIKPNAILVGEPGVGKTAIVEGLAQRIKAGKVPVSLKNRRIVELSISNLLSGTKYRGEFEERLKAILSEAEKDPDLILFIDEIHSVINAGDPSGSGDAANMLKPALSRGEISVIGATTLAEYRQYIEKDAAFSRRFSIVRIDEPSQTETLGILQGMTQRLESHHRLKITLDKLQVLVEMTARHLFLRRFPDKAIDVLDRACSKAAMENKNLEVSHIRQVIADVAGIAFADDSVDFKNRLNSLEQCLKTKIIGQDSAIDQICNLVRLCKEHLDLNPQRPDGVILLAGPPGVGKTAFAEVLAEALTGRNDNLIRLDMGQYHGPSSISALIGSVAGLVGYQDEPALIRGLRRCPAGVLLLDELDKADSEVLNLFSRAFEDGRLADAQGTIHNLSNITVIATLTISERHKSSLGFSTASGVASAKENRPKAHVGSTFRHQLKRKLSHPIIELFDEIIPFQALNEPDLESILENCLLKNLSHTLQKRFNRDLVLELTPQAKSTLLSLSDHQQQGARELSRVFQRSILEQIIRFIQNDAPQSGDMNLIIDWQDSNQQFSLGVG